MNTSTKLIAGLLLFVVLFACKSSTQNEQTVDEKIQSILGQITEPSIPDYTVSLLSFVSDTTPDYQKVFEKAIKHLHDKGGGKLNVEKGTYEINGPIHLISNLNLHLEKGADLKFGSNPKDYLPVVKTSWEGTFIYNYSPFIYGYNLNNVCISGEGTIDGEASESWNHWKNKQESDQLLSREMNHNSTPIEERIFGEDHFLRPQLIQFFDCKNILIEAIKIEDSPFWCIHLLRSENIIVRGIKFDAQNKNNDGIDQ